MLNDNWDIIIASDTRITEISGIKDVSFNGVTLSDRNLILFRDKRQALEDSFYHAIDHNFCNYDLSDTDTFKTIHEKESNTFRTSFGYNTAYYTAVIYEYFAESFSQYIENAEELHNYCPLTYEYFDELFN